jgi:hypothetical protein
MVEILLNEPRNTGTKLFTKHFEFLVGPPPPTPWVQNKRDPTEQES